MILALDSSTSWLSLAIGVVEHGSIRWLANRTQREGGKHTLALPAAIEQILFDAKVSPGQLTSCAVGIGPGSFTGLRVGLATVKGLAYGRQLSTAGVSSLRALAFEAMSHSTLVSRAGSPGARSCVAVLDARHGEIYAGIFGGPRAEPTGPELALRPDALAAALGEVRSQVRLVGEGVQVYRDVLRRDFDESQLAEGPLSPDARAVGELCIPLAPFSAEALFALEPHYVRPSEAEIKFPDGNFRPRMPD
jgi:tRNA threonylcarbamoyladenosine biosynthesis protein TsaB